MRTSAVAATPGRGRRSSRRPTPGRGKADRPGGSEEGRAEDESRPAGNPAERARAETADPRREQHRGETARDRNPGGLRQRVQRRRPAATSRCSASLSLAASAVAAENSSPAAATVAPAKATAEAEAPQAQRREAFHAAGGEPRAGRLPLPRRGDGEDRRVAALRANGASLRPVGQRRGLAALECHDRRGGGDELDPAEGCESGRGQYCASGAPFVRVCGERAPPGVPGARGGWSRSAGKSLAVDAAAMDHQRVRVRNVTIGLAAAALLAVAGAFGLTLAAGEGASSWIEMGLGTLAVVANASVALLIGLRHPGRPITASSSPPARSRSRWQGSRRSTPGTRCSRTRLARGGAPRFSGRTRAGRCCSWGLPRSPASSRWATPSPRWQRVAVAAARVIRCG